MIVTINQFCRLYEMYEPQNCICNNRQVTRLVFCLSAQLAEGYELKPIELGYLPKEKLGYLPKN